MRLPHGGRIFPFAVYRILLPSLKHSPNPSQAPLARISPCFNLILGQKLSSTVFSLVTLQSSDRTVSPAGSVHSGENNTQLFSYTLVPLRYWLLHRLHLSNKFSECDSLTGVAFFRRRVFFYSDRHVFSRFL